MKVAILGASPKPDRYSNKAQQRLERAEAFEPENITTICLLAEIYEQLKDQRAQALKDKCEKLWSLQK